MSTRPSAHRIADAPLAACRWCTRQALTPYVKAPRFVASKLKGLAPEAAKEALKSMEGEQGLMIIQIIDHGADLLMVGQRRKAKQYLIGNPLLAIQVNRYDIRAALYAPLRVLVFESEPGRTVVEFDQPSTLFGQFGRSEVTAVGVEDDDKLERILERAARTWG